ncbi:hypothetical protein QJS66_20585 [Kocuria rhizophila]|nr:hypothetical protein QJS66_20585 [Kocuria rhizophila]
MSKQPEQQENAIIAKAETRRRGTPSRTARWTRCSRRSSTGCRWWRTTRPNWTRSPSWTGSSTTRLVRGIPRPGDRLPVRRSSPARTTSAPERAADRAPQLQLWIKETGQKLLIIFEARRRGQGRRDQALHGAPTPRGAGGGAREAHGHRADAAVLPA